MVLKSEELRSSRCSSSPNSLLPSFFPELRLLTKSPSDWRRAWTPPCWQDRRSSGNQEVLSLTRMYYNLMPAVSKDVDGEEEEGAHPSGWTGWVANLARLPLPRRRLRLPPSSIHLFLLVVVLSHHRRFPLSSLPSAVLVVCVLLWSSSNMLLWMTVF